MTIKRKRIYEIIIISLVIMFTSLCAYMGITAVQKQMKLNLSFKANPNFYINVEIKPVDAADTVYNSIFDNQAGVIADGVKLSGATLSLDESFAENYQTDLGVAFSLRITNYMKDVGLLITTEGEGATALPTELAVKGTGSGANIGELDVYGSSTTLSTLKLTFEQAIIYSVTANAVEGATFNGNSDAVQGINYKATFESDKAGYEVGEVAVSVGGVALSSNNYTFQNGTLSINSNSVTGNIEITPVVSPIVYTITYNLDGGTNDARNPATYTVETKTFKLKIPTKSGYGFVGWNNSSSNPVRNIEIQKGTTGNLTFTANWGIAYTLKTGSDINSLIKNATSVTFDYFDNWKNKFSNWNSGYESASNDGNIRMFSSGNDKYILSHGMIMANAICNEMFYKCYKITNLSFNNFYTDNVTEMRYMLALGYDGEGMGDLSYLDELSFNTSKVTDMSYMFCSTKLSSTLDLSNLDTSNVTSMAGMFQRCNVEVLNLSNFDTSNVTSMGGMFSTCPTLTSLDLSSFDTSNVTNMSAMFNYCSSLKTIYVSDKWHMTSEANSSTSITGMFSNCTSLVGGNGTKYDSSNAKATYARIDDPTNGKPGYFTYKAAS